VIAAVVFDLDGVLVDSEPVWERVRRRYVAEHDGRWPDDAQRRLMGMSTSEWAAYLSELAGGRVPPDQVATQVIDAMAAEYERHLPLIPGSVDAVRRLAGRWPLAVASSSPPRLIRIVLDVSGLAAVFAATVSSEEVPRGKPAPDVYLAAAARIGADPAACAAVEDSSNGVRSAAAAGMRVVAVPRPEYPVDPDALALAAVALDAVAELTPETVERLDPAARPG
jgi:HAD superfamily hydrolase (TIGR01509 family)